jgi:hypothetical protein
MISLVAWLVLVVGLTKYRLFLMISLVAWLVLVVGLPNSHRLDSAARLEAVLAPALDFGLSPVSIFFSPNKMAFEMMTKVKAASMAEMMQIFDHAKKVGCVCFRCLRSLVLF